MGEPSLNQPVGKGHLWFITFHHPLVHNQSTMGIFDGSDWCSVTKKKSSKKRCKLWKQMDFTNQLDFQSHVFFNVWILNTWVFPASPIAGYSWMIFKLGVPPWLRKLHILGLQLQVHGFGYLGKTWKSMVAASAWSLPISHGNHESG